MVYSSLLCFLYGAYGRVTAENAKVPTAFILNEIKRLSDIELGIGAGYNTVMLDSCNLPDDENIQLSTCRNKGLGIIVEFL